MSDPAPRPGVEDSAANGPEAPTPAGPRISEAQLRYARWLGWGSTAGVAAIVVFFVLYLSGVVAPRVPIAELPALWTQPADAMMRATELGPGLAWLGMLRHADFLNLLGVAILAGCSVPALAAVIPVFWRSGARVFVTVCVLEILVMALAASGLLTGGGH